MNTKKTLPVVRFAAATMVLLGTVAARGEPSDALAKAATWQPPAVEDVHARVFAWLDERGADEPTRAKANELWSAVPDNPTGSEMLARLAQTFALADANARKLVELCSQPRAELVPPSHPWLADPKTPPFEALNLRLLYARWLVHETLYDEAMEQLAGIRPEDVVDPASLLFYQGVVHHRLLEKEAGLEAIDKLLDGAEQSPQRYAAVARLMQADLKGLKEDTLDHIARRMEDIERRLDLGRAGPKVRKVEDGVIESLDKLIKKLEEQQQQSGGGAGGNNIRSSSPAQDSQIIGGKGRGEVTKRDIGSKNGWGDLPPKQREEAMQQIGREFPSHYRDVIEQYFRKLANEGNESD